MMREQFPTMLEDVFARGFDRSERIGRDDAGRFCKGIRVRCSQCDAAVINGVAAHERTCPNEPWEDSDNTWSEDGDDTSMFQGGY